MIVTVLVASDGEVFELPKPVIVRGWEFAGRGADKRSKAVWQLLNACNKRYDMTPDSGLGIYRIQKPSAGMGKDAPYYVIVADHDRHCDEWPEMRLIVAPAWEPDDTLEAQAFALRHLRETVANSERDGFNRPVQSEKHYGLGMFLDKFGNNAGLIVGGG